MTGTGRISGRGKARLRDRAGIATIVAACLFTLACAGGQASQPRLAIAAASDLQFVFPDLIAAFAMHHPDTAVEPTFGASGTLTAQIASGAPFDVFFSADRAYPERLAHDGHADAATLTPYAIGHIVLWVPGSSPIDVRALGDQALLDARVRTVAIANPEHAPYGRAAIAALTTLGILDAVRPKLVFGENVAQAAQFAQSGAADAAVIGRSLAVSPKLANEGRWWEFPATSHPRLEQVAVVTTTSKNPAAARAFLAFVTSDEGRVILERHGLGAP